MTNFIKHLETYTAKELITVLNADRDINGKNEIKGTGTSKADLIKMIAAERKVIAETDFSDAPSIKGTKVEEEVTTITAVEIAAEIGKDPKSLRRKIRKIADELPETVKPGRWVFKLEYKEELIEKLS